MSSAVSKLILILPDLGGIGKSTIAEMLCAMLEIAGAPVVAIDGDPISRGLLARRAGRKTISVNWPEEHVSRAAAIRHAVRGGKIGILDFGGGSTLSLSVDPTISELCDGSADDVETIIAVIGESSKPGLASAVSRLRAAYPQVRFIFFRNFKSGYDWSSFNFGVKNLPVVDVPLIPSSITSWLANFNVLRNEKTGEISRIALADLVMEPQPNYNMIGSLVAGFLNAVSQQNAMQELFGLRPILNAKKLHPGLVLAAGPMSDEYLDAHQDAASTLWQLVNSAVPGSNDDRDVWMMKQGALVLRHAQARDLVKKILQTQSR